MVPCLCSLLASRLEQITLWKEKLVSLLQCPAPRCLLTRRHSSRRLQPSTLWATEQPGAPVWVGWGGCSKYPLSNFLSGEKKRRNWFSVAEGIHSFFIAPFQNYIKKLVCFKRINCVVFPAFFYFYSTFSTCFSLTPFFSLCCCPIREFWKSANSFRKTPQLLTTAKVKKKKKKKVIIT